MGTKFILLILLLHVALRESFAAEYPLRMMTFNIWISGANVRDGLYKITKHIRILDPDIVALQETESGAVATNLTRLLGPKWTSHVHGYHTFPDTAILTKHKMVTEEKGEVWAGVGVPIIIEKGFQSVSVNFWSMHLEYRAYGPYAANNKQVTNWTQIMAGEKNKAENGRYANMKELVENAQFNKFLQMTSERPLIVAGDFNSPSHLDWIEETKSIHGGWAFDWPATKLLMDYANVTDSFRAIHPNVTETPGNTWSTVNKFNAEWDYKDRIDFIFYKGEKVKPVDSFTYCGTEPLQIMPNHWRNDYPSDHFAVVTDFIFKA